MLDVICNDRRTPVTDCGDATMAATDEHLHWPQKHILFGVKVSATDYAQCEQLIMAAARDHRSAVVTHMPVHGLVTAATDAEYRSHVNDFDIVAPDGQPVRWALNRFHGTALSDRCYGPTLMLRLCEAAAKQDVGVYLYGSTPQVIQSLSQRLASIIPALRIVGTESPPFRPLTSEEDASVVERINSSGAGLVFLGLGCPRQDIFASEHRDRIHAVQMCVGAAFDFHAGTKPQAPSWMQRRGLEWLFRLITEPRRLWRRYLVTNSIFLWLCARSLVRRADATPAIKAVV
jgi:exopolysaccharide biosynthesis WecB/TagA/CpsF family protein